MTKSTVNLIIGISYQLIKFSFYKDSSRYHVPLIDDDHIEAFEYLHNQSIADLKDPNCQSSIIVGVDHDKVYPLINNVCWSDKGVEEEGLFYLSQYPVLSFKDKTLSNLINTLEDNPRKQYYKYRWRLRVSNPSQSEFDYGDKVGEGSYQTREFATCDIAKNYVIDNNLPYKRVVIYRPATFNL